MTTANEVLSAATVLREMAAAGGSPQQSGEVARYIPTQTSTPLRTRSQRQSLAEPLHAGNLQAYLESIPLDDVQSVLSRHFLKHQGNRSIFTHLVNPGDGVLPYEAATAVLEELAGETENVAILATLAYRLIEARGLWKGHPNPSVKSAEDLVRTLDVGRDIAQANIVMGASALRQRQRYVRLIDEAWKPGWLEEIPRYIRPTTWTRPEDLPRDMLVQMTANAKQNISLSDAVARWTDRITRRTDHGIRRAEGIRGPTVPHLILSDVKHLNRIIKDDDRGRRTSDMFFPEDAPTDGLEVKLAALQSTPLRRPDYLASGRRGTAKKRKRGGSVEADRADEAEDCVADDGGWRSGKDGMMVKRVKNQLIRRLPTAEELAAAEMPSSELLPKAATQSDDDSPAQYDSQPASKASCDGPGIALLLGKFVDLHHELRSLDTDTVRLARQCCDSCRVFVLRALASLEADLVPCVQGLEQVSKHVFDGSEVQPSQDHGISPRKKLPASEPRGNLDFYVVSDSSDGSDGD